MSWYDVMYVFHTSMYVTSKLKNPHKAGFLVNISVNVSVQRCTLKFQIQNACLEQ